MGKKLKIVSIIYYHQVKGGKNVYLEIYVHLHFYQKPPWAYQPAKKKIENTLKIIWNIIMIQLMFSFPHVHFYANAVGFTTSNQPEFPLNLGRAEDLHQHANLLYIYRIILDIKAPRPRDLGANDKSQEAKTTFPPQDHIEIRDQLEAFPK